MSKPVQKLTAAERARYAELKTIVNDGMAGFMKTALAMVEISDNRYYIEDGYSSFAEFCQAEHDMTAARAYQLCQAAETVKGLPPKCQPLVDTERKARALAKASEEERPGVLKAAAKKAKREKRKMSSTDIAAEVTPLPSPAPLILGEEIKDTAKELLETWPEGDEVDNGQALRVFFAEIKASIQAIPKGADLARFAGALEAEAEALRNKIKDQKNRLAYTR